MRAVTVARSPGGSISRIFWSSSTWFLQGEDFHAVRRELVDTLLEPLVLLAETRDLRNTVDEANDRPGHSIGGLLQRREERLSASAQRVSDTCALRSYVEGHREKRDYEQHYEKSGGAFESSGGEHENLSDYPLGVLVLTLRGRCPRQVRPLDCSTTCNTSNSSRQAPDPMTTDCSGRSAVMMGIPVS